MTSQIITRTEPVAPHTETATLCLALKQRTDLIGYTVGVVGGDVGTVDPATADADRADLVLRVGRRGFRRKVVVPAGAINCVDHASRRAYLQGNKEMVNAAPLLDPARRTTSHHRWYRATARLSQ